MSLLLANIIGWIVAHWRIVAVAGVVVFCVIVFGLIFRSCNTPKLNEVEIQKAEQAVKERNDAALKEILVQSDVREAAIDANVAYAENKTVNAIAEAREKYANMNTSELAAELEKRK